MSCQDGQDIFVATAGLLLLVDDEIHCGMASLTCKSENFALFGMSLLLAGNGGMAREGCAALWTHQE
jgi:hypothetical protein